MKGARPGQGGSHLDRRRNRRRSPTLEGLEGRYLLSVTSSVDSSGLLLVTADSDEPVTIGSISGDVKVDGLDPGSGPLPSEDITSIEIVCTASTGPDSNVIDLGEATPPNFVDLASVTVDGGGGENTLIGPDVPATWGLTSPDAGILAGDALGAITSFTFASIQNLVGGPDDDDFVFAQGASLSGSIDGGGGYDILDFSGLVDDVSVTLTGSDADGYSGSATRIGAGFRGIDSLIGSLGVDTLTGDNAECTWDLDGDPTYNDGNSAPLSFSQFGNLQGGSGSNTFLLIGDSLGNLTENLDGGGGDDRFVFESGVVLTGSISGGGGYNTLDFSDYGIGVDVEVTGSDPEGYAGTEATAFSGGFQGIDSLVADLSGGATNIITGEDSTGLWSLGPTLSYDDGSGRSLAFSGFDEIDGGTGDDTYQLDQAAGAALTLDNEGGDDTLDFSNATFGVAIDLDSPEAQTIAPGRTLTLDGSFQNIIGSPLPDAITLDGSDEPRFVEGGLPDTSPGDILTFDAGGLPVTLTPTQIIASGLAPVTYSGIESTKITNDSGLTVVRQPVTSTLTSNPAATQYGKPVTFTLDVAATLGPETPTGSVQLAIDGVPFGAAIPLVGGVAVSPPIATLDAGPHTITASYSGDSNFAPDTANPTTLDVAKAPLTVAARESARPEGQPNPAFGASYSGFVLGQGPSVLGGTLTLTTPATATSPPGNYAITPGGLTSADYAISYVDGTLSVTAASSKSGSTISLVPNILSPIYGQSLTFTATVTAADSGRPTLTGTVQFVIDGSNFGPAVTLVNGVATSAAFASPSAGSHMVSAMYSGNSAFTTSTANLGTNVAKAPLTITADDATKIYGQANPTFTASYDGFVLGQDGGVLGGALAFVTAATSASHVGNYPIIASGAISDDYSITFVPGTLTVTPALLTVSAMNVIKAYGLPVPTLTASYSGFVNGDGPPSLTTPVTLSTTATASSTTGFYPIIASGASSPDYTITYVDGVLTVPPSVTTSSPGWIAFVSTLFQDILGRTPDAPGLDYWLERLADGTSRAEVNREFYESAEYRTLKAEHKAPKINQKTSLADAIHADELASVPPAALTNPGPIALVTTLYREILNRAPEPSGQQYWLEELAIGTPSTTVALDIYNSPEHKTLEKQHTAPRISERTALADALKAEKVAVRINTPIPTGPMELS
jgi:MBG domain (YGX type)/Bacterial Ig-like domain (group 3)/Domain of unknown function (DUF4214)